jgi:chemosensory pili system protein ChpA (sensor histidine kinase/response regulator)
MVDRHDYVALEWVKGEIADTLKQARAALDAYADCTPASKPSRSAWRAFIRSTAACRWSSSTARHLLAEEMEHLAQALQAGRVSQREEGIRLLQQALGQLPLYLDRVHSARRDWPLVVLPLLNDLRSARGQPLLSETSLFSPPLQVIARRWMPEKPWPSLQRCKTFAERTACPAST